MTFLLTSIGAIKAPSPASRIRYENWSFGCVCVFLENPHILVPVINSLAKRAIFNFRFRLCFQLYTVFIIFHRMNFVIEPWAIILSKAQIRLNQASQPGLRLVKVISMNQVTNFALCSMKSSVGLLAKDGPFERIWRIGRRMLWIWSLNSSKQTESGFTNPSYMCVVCD